MIMYTNSDKLIPLISRDLSKKLIKWDTEYLIKHLNMPSNSASSKSLERALNDSENFPKSLKANMVSTNNTETLTSVLNSLLKKAKSRRDHIFTLQIKKISKKIIIFLNDQRMKKHWFILEKEEDLYKNLDEIFISILKYSNKNVSIFPSDEAISICINTLSKWNSKSNNFNSAHTLSLETSMFNHEKVDVKIFRNRKIPKKYNSVSEISHLDKLESESIHIMREAVSESSNPVMLYSIGKDSAVMLHLAMKAFYPSTPPFPLLHVDTRWKFKAMYDFRESISKAYGMDLIVHINQDGVEKNINPIDHGSSIHTDIMKTQGLKQALDKYGYDLAFGGARRDEEKSRSKERVFSFRTSSHSWNPKNQRPEIWNLYNARMSIGESIRAFPLSNWTEIDIWQYIYRESIPIVPLYFSKERPCIERDGNLIMVDDNRLNIFDDEKIEIKKIRFRTLGCYPLTGAIESNAQDLPGIINEIMNSNHSEREGRTIDKETQSSMEKKKNEGYF